MRTPRPVSIRALDIGSRYPLVKRLICGHPAFRAAVSSGVDPDDLRQDVLLALVCRQTGQSAYDPERSSLSTYVWLCTWSSVADYLRRNRRHRHPVAAEAHEAICFEHGAMSHEAQLYRACSELGLGDEAYRVVLRIAQGTLRRDDGDVVALGALVRERIAG